MALTLVSPGIQPLGQYDAYSTADGAATNWAPLGGEVAVLMSAGTDTDGYQIVRCRAAATGDTGPFYLADDGLVGYGVLFGATVVRTDTGFASGSDTGARLGPASYKASGKVTLWDKPGQYAVSFDALVGSEASFKALTPGAYLGVETLTGKLKSTGGSSTNTPARCVSFKIDESLVTTGGATVNHKKLVISFDGNVVATIA